MSPVRILVNDYAGHPFQAQLSRALVRRGATVLHTYCTSYVTGRGDLSRRPGDPDGLRFAPLELRDQFAKHSIFKRFKQEREFASLLMAAADDFAPDVIISANTPLFAQRRILGYARRRNVRFVFWLQDLISVAMAAELQRRLPLIGSAGARYLAWVERKTLAGSDHVVAITSAFLPILRRSGVDSARTSVIRNWAPIDEVLPAPRRNPWAIEHGLADGLVFLYAGTLGLKHDPMLLVHLAAAVAPATVAVVSEGAGADLIRREAEQRRVPNVTVIPFQPYERLPDVLATGDVLLVILEADAGVFSVPSKVLTYLCANRPILASVPAANLASDVIRESGGGLTADPGSVDDWIAKASELASNERLRTSLAAQGRRYAEREFDIERIADQFADLTLIDEPTRNRKEIRDVAHAA